LTFRLVYVCIKWCRDVLEDLRVNRYGNLADPGLGLGKSDSSRLNLADPGLGMGKSDSSRFRPYRCT